MEKVSHPAVAWGTLSKQLRICRLGAGLVTAVEGSHSAAPPGLGLGRPPKLTHCNHGPQGNQVPSWGF